MIDALIQMAALIGCGVLWRFLTPLVVAPATGRQVITSLVYVLFLPALVLDVLWQAPLGVDSARIALLAGAGVAAGLLLSGMVYRLLRTPPALAGALILAAAFPNATYLGLPVLEATLGTWARSVAIQYDLFACTPLLLTVGVLVASRYGTAPAAVNPLKTLLAVPPLWAASLGVVLNIFDVPLPDGLHRWLGMLGGAVVPLMLLALGMGLHWSAMQRSTLILLVPVIVIQLAIMPALVWWLGTGVGLDRAWLVAVVLEAAMPSMVLGVVFCDRYQLDTGAYAMAVTISTLLSFISLPLWFGLLA
ncbi:MAG: auxin efflux carrier [Gammaproteobacteria bacterium]|nr:MAG: auxin efflux carrier [Gammaproteobacteria bacterium]TND06826.1 MAG: auxin efflux carrier [Gammaproteobacteria bacterium]